MDGDNVVRAIVPRSPEGGCSGSFSAELLRGANLLQRKVPESLSSISLRVSLIKFVFCVPGASGFIPWALISSLVNWVLIIGLLTRIRRFNINTVFRPLPDT